MLKACGWADNVTKCLRAISICVAFAVQSAQAQSFAIVGDAGVWNEKTESVRNSIVRSGVHRLILPGDNLYDKNASYFSVWSPWSQAGLSFELATIGNHHGGYAKEVAFFKMPGEYGAIKRDGALFLFLNSDNELTAPEQAHWLDEQLTIASEPLVFLVYHHPNAIHHFYHRWNRKKEFDKAIVPIILRHRSKLTALISGHVHLAAMASYNDLPVIISGATHDVRWGLPKRRNRGPFTVQTHWYFDYKPYWVRLDMNAGQGEAIVSFVRANDDVVAYQAKLRTGRALEPMRCSDILTRLSRRLRLRF